MLLYKKVSSRCLSDELLLWVVVVVAVVVSRRACTFFGAQIHEHVLRQNSFIYVCKLYMRMQAMSVWLDGWLASCMDGCPIQPIPK